MKKLITICVIVSLMLSLTGISSAAMVNAPPVSPSWWNQEGELYAYGWWQTDIEQLALGEVSPPDNATHWASNYLYNVEFEASLDENVLTIELGNEFRPDLFKQIYIYVTGTTQSTTEDIVSNLNTDGGVFTGDSSQNISQDGTWHYIVSGEIRPQPAYVWLTLTVPGLTDVTNIWVGENCIPEPATICMLGLGALSLIRRKKIA